MVIWMYWPLLGLVIRFNGIEMDRQKFHIRKEGWKITHSRFPCGFYMPVNESIQLLKRKQTMKFRIHIRTRIWNNITQIGPIACILYIEKRLCPSIPTLHSAWPKKGEQDNDMIHLQIDSIYIWCSALLFGNETFHDQNSFLYFVVVVIALFVNRV